MFVIQLTVYLAFLAINCFDVHWSIRRIFGSIRCWNAFFTSTKQIDLIVSGKNVTYQINFLLTRYCFIYYISTWYWCMFFFSSFAGYFCDSYGCVIWKAIDKTVDESSFTQFTSNCIYSAIATLNLFFAFRLIFTNGKHFITARIFSLKFGFQPIFT